MTACRGWPTGTTKRQPASELALARTPSGLEHGPRQWGPSGDCVRSARYIDSRRASNEPAAASARAACFFLRFVLSRRWWSGPRRGKFREGGGVKATPPSNVPVVTLGVFILWLGWFGFNGGSQLALSGAADAVAVSNILANTNLAAAAGVMAAIGLSRPVLGRVDLLAGLNGAIAGLVAITAGPDLVEHHWAVVIGAVGGAICVAGLKLMERMRIDDVVGAVPAHLFAGVWGTLAVCIAAGGDLLVQIGGVLAIGAFVFGASMLLWWVIDRTVGARVSPVVEELGQDVAELGIEAYPEFVIMPETDD